MQDALTRAENAAIAIIGRNEGDRLGLGIDSALACSKDVFYVDSGSTDGSLKKALEKGVMSIALDESRPFTAARARNRGFAEIDKLARGVEYVQFLDGDCELDPNWLHEATVFLEENPNCAAVSGRLRERHPERSIYNLLCDIELNQPAGETDATGGIFLIRRAVFENVGGFREDLIAGEELELFSRIRAEGWTIWRIDADMALHDVNMTRFSQWWKRAVRCGFTYAQAYHEMNQNLGHKFKRSVFWGGFLPLIILGLSVFWGTGALYLFVIYLLQIVRLTYRGTYSLAINVLDATFLTIGKFAEMLGVLKYYSNRAFRLTDRLIEYK